MGSKAGKWLGFLASIAILPVVMVATTLLAILVGLPMGALTLIVAPLQFIKTTYNYINEKFQEELQSNTNEQKIPMDNKPVPDMGYKKPSLVWSQQKKNQATNTQNPQDTFGSEINQVDEVFVEPAPRSSGSCIVC